MPEGNEAMHHFAETSNPYKPQAGEVPSEPSLARRILMFPLSRILIAAGLFLVLQVPLGRGSSILPGALQGQILTQLVSLVVAIGVFAFMGRMVEGRAVVDVGLPREGALPRTATGFLVGGAAIGSIVGILALRGWYDVHSVAAAWQPLLYGLTLFFLVAVAEELLFRGVLFRVLEEGVGSWTALTLIAVLFGLVHLVNSNATWLGAVGTGLAGVMLGAAYLATRDVWLAIGIHWSLNFAQGTIFGMPVSGRDAGESLLQATVRGPELWSGGAFGIEAGLVTFLVLAVGSAALLWLAVRRHHIVVPRWMQRGRGRSSLRG